MSRVHIHVMIMLLTCFVASIDGLLVTYDVNIMLNLLHFKELYKKVGPLSAPLMFRCCCHLASVGDHVKLRF